MAMRSLDSHKTEHLVTVIHSRDSDGNFVKIGPPRESCERAIAILLNPTRIVEVMVACGTQHRNRFIRIVAADSLAVAGFKLLIATRFGR